MKNNYNKLKRVSVHNYFMASVSISAILLTSSFSFAASSVLNPANCNRSGTAINCSGGLSHDFFGVRNYGISEDESAFEQQTTAINVQNLTGSSTSDRSHIIANQNGDIAVSVAGGKGVAQSAMEFASLSSVDDEITQQQVIDFFAQSNLPDAPDAVKIAQVYALADSNADGKVSLEELFSFGDATYHAEEIANLVQGGTTVTKQEVRSYISGMYAIVVTDAEVTALLDSLPANADGSLNVSDIQGALPEFVVTHYDLEAGIAQDRPRLVTNTSAGSVNLPSVIGVQSRTGTVNISNNVDLGLNVSAPAPGAAADPQEPRSGAALYAQSGAYDWDPAQGEVRILGSDIAVDNSGNIVVTGDASGIHASSIRGNVTLNNSGDISLTMPDASGEYAGIHARSEQGGNVTVNNSGNITLNTNDSFGITSSGDNGGNISITNSGDITANGDFNKGIEAFTDAGNVAINNTGDIAMNGDGDIGILAGVDSSVGTVDITSSGNVTASGANSYGIIAFNPGGGAVNINITSGTVSGGSGATELSFSEENGNDRTLGSAGIVVLSQGENSIVNNGIITASNGQAIGVFEGTMTFEDGYTDENGDYVSEIKEVIIAAGNEAIDNRGSILGDVNLGNGTNSLSNSGTVTGNLTTGSGDDSVANSGILTGNSILGDGNNTVANAAGGTLTGDVTAGTGNDSVANEGALTGNLVLGGGANVVTNAAGSTLTGDVTTGTGNDSVTNAGTVTGNLVLGDGNNTVANAAGGTLTGDVTAGAGNDSVTNAGTVTGNLVLGDGTNVVTNAAGGTLTGNVATGTGNDNVTNEGNVSGNATLGDGDNTIDNKGTWLGRIASGLGLDKLLNSGTVTGNVDLGKGDNDVANSGTLTGNLTTDDGNDKLANSGTLTGNVDLGDGNNTVTNAAGATLAGNLKTGSGDDSVTNDGTLTGNVALGDGANSFANSAAYGGNVTAGAGNDSFTNSGIFTGDVSLGEGANSFSNTGTFSSATVNVGAGNTVTNAGTLSPGGNGTIATTTVTGNFVQTADGNLDIDINDQASGAKNDVIAVSGSASLAGTVTPHITNLSREIDGEFVIMTAQGGVSDDGATLNEAEVNPGAGVTVNDLAGIDFEIDFNEANQVVLKTTSLSVGATLGLDGGTPTSTGNKNIAALGNALDTATSSATLSTNAKKELRTLANALRTQTSSAEAKKAAARLIPQNQGQQGTNAAGAMAGFGNAMLSCKQATGDQKYTREGQCYWAKIQGRKLDRDATAEHAGSDEKGLEFMGGVQFALWDELRLGVALGYEDSRSDSFDANQKLGKTEGKRFQGGIVLKNQWGPVNAYLNLAGSYGDFDTTRYGLLNNNLGSQKITTGMSRLRLSYLMNGNSDFYIKPMVDLNATYLHLGGYTETGLGAMTIASSNEWLLSVSPSVEVGGETTFGNGMLLRPYVRVGATFLDTDKLTTSVSFAAAPGMVPFEVTSGLDTVTADVEAGFFILDGNGFNTQFNYEGHFSEDTKQHAISLKLSVDF